MSANTATIDTIRQHIAAATQATAAGAPVIPSNPFFGVGPITDMVHDAVEARRLRFQFEAWLEKTYPKFTDQGVPNGVFTAAELGRSMHRGDPADHVLLDMMRTIHRYFGFPAENQLAVGLGGGHSGFTVAALHLMSANDPAQQVFVDTPKPESDAAKAGGFFRQSWASQLVELQQLSAKGDAARIHFPTGEGHIPPAKELLAQGVRLFFGVGHETTGATTYTQDEVEALLAWIAADPAKHHAVIDATSLLGAMPWPDALVKRFTRECCFFMPFQKAIGGIAGYYCMTLTPAARTLIDCNQKDPSWAIPRQLKLAVPVDGRVPLTGEKSIGLGPLYDPVQDKMLGGVINTFSTLAFAETTFGLQRCARMIGPVETLNQRSCANRAAIDTWIAGQSLFSLAVENPDRRGAAVTLIKVNDPDCTDPALHARVLARSKQLLGYEGLTHSDGRHEPGLDGARYVNAFPGTPGDYRAWIGGLRPVSDIVALLETLKYAWARAKILVLEEELQKAGAPVRAASSAAPSAQETSTADRAFAVLVCDLVGLAHDASGKPDPSDVQRHIEARGGVFHMGGKSADAALQAGKIHFFYQPHLATAADLREAAGGDRYDAVIAAATTIPPDVTFTHGGVRIGAGTGNMQSASWGGGSGDGGAGALMNTPGFNSRATAQMAMKALLNVIPDLPVAALHERCLAGAFDTGRDLASVPTDKLEGKTIAILGYGNIGRELAKLARAFGMDVVVHARAPHQAAIESEGFRYATTAEEAARDAHVLSVHTGLGAVNRDTGRFANQDLVNGAVLGLLAPGAIVLNYDRGELIDCAALGEALACGRVRHAAIDADLFRNETTGALSGPLAPYLPLAKRFPGRVALLPHAAADTDHGSRVAGAKQAVDQIFDLILNKQVTNLKGTLPEGHTDAGTRSVRGVGAVTGGVLAQACETTGALREARACAENLAALWGALDSVQDPAHRQELLKRHGAELVLTSNRYGALMARLGLEGPFRA